MNDYKAGGHERGAGAPSPQWAVVAGRMAEHVRPRVGRLDLGVHPPGVVAAPVQPQAARLTRRSTAPRPRSSPRRPTTVSPRAVSPAASGASGRNRASPPCPRSGARRPRAPAAAGPVRRPTDRCGRAPPPRRPRPVPARGRRRRRRGGRHLDRGPQRQPARHRERVRPLQARPQPRHPGADRRHTPRRPLGPVDQRADPQRIGLEARGETGAPESAISIIWIVWLRSSCASSRTRTRF